MALSDDFVDALLFTDVDLLRFEASQNREVAGILAALEEDLVKALKDIDPAEPVTQAAQRRRLVLLEVEAGKASRKAFQEIGRGFRSNFRELTGIVGEDTIAQVNRVVGTTVLTRSVPSAAGNAIVDDLLVLGASSPDWLQAQNQSTTRRFMQDAREGILTAEEGLTGAIRRVRGTPAINRRDGVRAFAQRQSEAISNTFTNALVNETRMEVYRQNSDVIRGVQALNLRPVSAVCRARAGHAWNLQTGRPFPGTSGSFPGAPPWHWNCKTVLIPILRTLPQLARVPSGQARGVRRRLSRLSDDKLVALDGKPASGLTYDGWLKKQTVAQQREALGPGKFKLWSEGKLSMTDLINQRGRPLTIPQIKERIEGRKPK